MARTALQKVYADFRQGFVTVANPLAYPEGSLKDIVNFDIQDNGTVRLRPGLRQETSTTVDTGLTLSDVNSLAMSVHMWDNVANQGNVRIAVVQVGSLLHLYPMEDSGIDLDNPVLPEPIDLALPSDKEGITISAASGSGWLFVTHPSIKPFVLVKEGNSIETVEITIRIRDLLLWEGSTDSETGFGRANSMSPVHEYNLRNAGWPEKARVSREADANEGTAGGQDPVYWTRLKINIYPPISIPFYVGRAGGGDIIEEQIAFNPWQLENDYFGNTVIPLGHNIVEASSWSRRGDGTMPMQDGGTSTSLERTYSWTQNPTSVEFYSGRVWYTGAKGYQEQTSLDLEYDRKDDINVSNTIYYSQDVQDNLSKIGRCYQENDPTAEDINQLLSTDGGTISIRGAGEIFDIKAFGTALVVFSSNGVWSISGVDANSFKADSFSVNKISNIGPSSKNTISSTNNNIYYIANDAIYILTVDDVTAQPRPQDITSAKIKDFYTSIPYRQKENAKAFFDTSNRVFYMFYSDVEDVDGSVTNLSYNKALVFNQDLGAFYKYDVSLSDRYIIDGLFYSKDQAVTLSEAITVGGVPVTVDGEPLQLSETYSTASLNNIQLLTIVDDGTAKFTFSSFTDNTTYTDWGEAYEGFVEFGFDTAGDIMRDSYKAPVIITHMERTEDGFEVNPEDPEGQELRLTNTSGCLMSYGWDWATNYKNPFQIYRFHRNYVPSGTEDPFNYGVDVITTRNRIRGKGHSLGLRLDSEAGKDCRLLGIGILYTAARDI